MLSKPLKRPCPGLNYLGSESYFGLISNTAGGYSFYKDARLRRLTRYRYNNAPLDMGGRFIYLRDNAASQAWSPSWMPVRKNLDSYECRHEMGYTVIKSELAGLASQTRYFVPLDENLEIWELTLINKRNQPATLSVFSAVEFNLWDAMDDAANFQRNYSIGEVEVVDGIVYHKTEYRERRNHFAFFACSEKLVGFDTHWNDVAISQWILGIRPTYDGLQIDPVIPSGWDGFEAARSYRGVRYQIRVERKGLGRGIQLQVNGSPITGTIVPIPPAETRETQVVVLLG